MELYLCYFIIYIIEAFILWFYTSALFQKKHKKYIELSLLFTLYMVLYGISFIDNYLLNTIAFFIANFLFIFVTCCTNIQFSLFHGAILTTVMSTSELIIFNISSYFIPEFFSESNTIFSIVILTIFSKLLYFLILFLLSHILCTKNHNSTSYNKATLFLSLVPISTIFVLMTLINVSTNTIPFLSMDWMLSISSFLMLGINIFIFSFHHYIQKENIKRTELELLLQKEYDSAQYYKMLLEQTENQNILIHDMKKHLQSIAILNENKAYDKISAYISHLIHSSSLQNNPNLCEHKIFNSILGQYQRLCNDKHINFEIDIRHHTVDFLEISDLTALFCNLLDNAVEVSEHLPNALIELSVSHKNNTPFTIITIILYLFFK